jgi:SAM-dependent methyltransferase
MGASLLAQMPQEGLTHTDSVHAFPVHVVQWAPTRQCAKHEATLVCPPDALALPDECIDVTLVHHFLEHCPNAHRGLAEAARVTSDNGVLVIFGFHPLGVATLEHRLGQRRREYPGNGAWKTPGKLRDWLEFVDFEVERVDYCGFRGHGTRACRERWEVPGRRYNLPWGASYMIRARRKRHRAPIQRLRFGLEAPVASRPLGATRLQPVPPDNNTSKRKKR